MIKKLQEEYVSDVDVQAAAFILTKCLAEKTDNPRKNIEVSVLTPDGLRYLDESAMDKIVTKIEEERAEEMQEEK